MTHENQNTADTTPAGTALVHVGPLPTDTGAAVVFQYEQQEMTHAAAVTWCLDLLNQCAAAAARDDAPVWSASVVALEMTLEDLQRRPRGSYTLGSLLHTARAYGFNDENQTPEQRRFLSEVREYNRTSWTPDRVAAFRTLLETDPVRGGPLFRYVFASFIDPVKEYLESLGSDASRSGMRTSLRTVYRLMNITPDNDGDSSAIVSWFWFTFDAARFSEVRALLVKEDYKPATVNHVLSAVRGVVHQMWYLGYITKEDAERISSVRNVANHQDEPAGREILLAEMRTILFRCTLDITDPVRGAAAFRDAALLSLLWSTGIRRQELARLSVSSVDITSGEIHIIGKGNKPRTVYVAGGALEALTAWTSHRALFHNGTEPAPDAPLFPNIDRWGCVGNRYMSFESINRIVTRRYKDAGLEALTPHDFRRTFVGNMLTAGVDILTVGGICGHSSVTTTARYDRRKNEQRRNAAALVLTPYGA